MEFSSVSRTFKGTHFANWGHFSFCSSCFPFSYFQIHFSAIYNSFITLFKFFMFFFNLTSPRLSVCPFWKLIFDPLAPNLFRSNFAYILTVDGNAVLFHCFLNIFIHFIDIWQYYILYFPWGEQKFPTWRITHLAQFLTLYWNARKYPIRLSPPFIVYNNKPIKIML